MRFWSFSLLIVLALTVIAPRSASANAASAYAKAKHSYQRLIDSPRKQRYRDQWQRVIDRLTAIPERYPGAAEGAAALYLAGKAGRGLYEVSRLKDDARLAVRYFSQVATSYPESSLADDALLLAGDIEREILHDDDGARALYRQIGARYPHGDMAVSAAQRCSVLGGCPAPATAPVAASASGQTTAPAPAAANAGEPAQLTGVRFWSNPGYTRVVLDLSGPVQFLSNLLAGDAAKGVNPRLYLDLVKTTPAAGLADTTRVDDGLLKQIRTGQPDTSRTRVVLDLVSFHDYKVFPLQDPARIVIDVSGDGSPALQDDAPALSTLPGKDGISKILEQAPTEPPVKLHIPQNGGGGLRRIVVDAGHGGKDPGAIGPDGLMEKDVTLAMARILARKLEKDLGCEVILTRDGDVFLPLEERTAIANKVDADLFISLHANASTKGECLRGRDLLPQLLQKRPGGRGRRPRERHLAEAGRRPGADPARSDGQCQDQRIEPAGSGYPAFPGQGP